MLSNAQRPPEPVCSPVNAAWKAARVDMIIAVAGGGGGGAASVVTLRLAVNALLPSLLTAATAIW